MLSSRHTTLACALIVCIAARLNAQTTTPAAISWYGIAGNDFAMSANWTNGTIVSDVVSTIATFDNMALTQQANVGASFQVAGVRFASTGVQAFTVSGTAPLTIGSSGVENQTTSVNQTVSAPLVFAGSAAAITNQGTLTLSGSITNNTSGSITLAGAGAGGTISGSINGAAGLVKNGTGKWTISGANTFLGSTTLNSGTLVISSDSSLGSAPTSPTPGALTFNGGTLETTASFELSSNRRIAVTSAGGTLQTDAGTTLTYGGYVDAPSGSALNKSGTGTLVLSGVNGYSGATNVQAGTLRAGTASAFSPASLFGVASGATLDVPTSQTIGGLTDVTGTSGNVTVSSGATLTLAGAGMFSGNIGGAGGVATSSGASQTLAGASTYAGGTAINGGMLIATNLSGSATGTGQITIASGGMLQLGNNAAGGGVSGNIINNGSVLFASTDTTASYGGVISGSGSVNIGMSNTTGTGALTLAAANTYTGTTNINSGTLIIGHVNALPTGTAVGLGNVATLDVANDQTIARISNSSATSLIQLVNGATLTIAPSASTYGGTFSGSLIGGGNLTLAGAPGTGLTIAAANPSYTGATSVTGGTLYVASGSLGTGQLSLSAGTTLAVSKTNGGDVTLANPVSLASGVSLNGNSDAGLILNGNLTVASGASTLHVGNFVELGGPLKASGPTTLTVDSISGGFGHVVLLAAPDSSVATLVASNAGVIFGSPAAVPTSGLTLQASQGYIGVAKGTAGAPSVSSVLSLIDKANFNGVLGFDTLQRTAPPAVFSDTIDVSAFSNLTLGSATQAVLTGTIVPASTGYAFGNGGGVLFIQSPLTGSYGVTVSSTTAVPGNEFTAVFQGNNSYTGNLSVTNSVAVLDGSVAGGVTLPTGSKVVLGANGYIGITEGFTGASSFSDFVNNRLAVGGYTPTSVIGLDSAAYASAAIATGKGSGQRTVSETIDLTGFGPIYLGTATNVVLTGSILAPNQAGANRTLSLLAVGDGTLTISSPLVAGNVGSVVVGSGAAYATGTVALTGANTFAGGTTLNSGTLAVSGSSKGTTTSLTRGPLGTGTLTVATNAQHPILTTTGGTVTLNNPLALGSALQIGLPSGSITSGPSTTDTTSYSNSLMMLAGVITDLDALHAGSLTIYGNTVLNGANTFSGGVNLTSGMLMLGNDAALGTGTLTFSPGQTVSGGMVTLGTFNGARTIANNLVFDGASQATVMFTGQQGFTFSGSLALKNDVTLSPSGQSLTFNGPVTGFGGVLANGSGSITLNGTNSYSGGTESKTGAIIFGNASSLPAAPATNALLADVAGYIGIGFVPANLQSEFLNRFSKGGTTGTIGFDTPSGATTPNTFSDPIDLRGFAASMRLGSTSSAVLSGAITPQQSTYNFGNGGGLLTVSSALTNDPLSPTSPRIVNVSSTDNVGLTLRLTGANTYTGGTLVTNSGVIFGNAALPATGYVQATAGAYVGTEDLTFMSAPSTFLTRVVATSGAIVGFDSFTGSPANVSSAIVLPYSGVYLGTATQATLSGALTLAAGDTAYRFAGYKGGRLTVATPLTGSNGVIIGDSSAETFYGTGLSSVTLTGANTYTGGTTLNAGALYVGSDGALGTQALSVVDNYNGSGRHLALLASGGARSLANAIQVGSADLDLGGDLNLTLTGALSGTTSGALYKIGAGTLTLSGNNSALAADLYVQQGSVTFSNAAALGVGALRFDSTGGANATLLGGGTVNGIEGYNAGDTITLTNGTALTVNQTFDADYLGSFSGNTAGLTFSGTGTAGASVKLRLSGASTYTGPTTIQSGISITAGNAASFGPSTNSVTLNGGKLAVDSGVTIANPITLNSGKVGGTGTFQLSSSLTPFDIHTGIVLTPGISGPGVLAFDRGAGLITTSVLILNQGGGYTWQLTDATNSTAGWDVVTVNGTVNLAATSTAPFNFKLVTVAPDGSASYATNFNPNQSYSWTVLNASSITGFTGANQFTIDSSSFLNPNSGTFSLGLSGNSLVLNFSPVPEPSAYALLAAGLGITLVVWRRRRR